MNLPFTYSLSPPPPSPAIVPSRSSTEVAAYSEPGLGPGHNGHSTLVHSNAFNVEFARLDLIDIENVTVDVDAYHDFDNRQMNESVCNLQKRHEYNGSRTWKFGLNQPHSYLYKSAVVLRSRQVLTYIDSSCCPRL
jgi:phosphoribulokinase